MELRIEEHDAQGVVEQMREYTVESDSHRAGVVPYSTLERLAEILPPSMGRTAETGCGRTTVFFSQISDHHTVFCLDDRAHGDEASVGYYECHPACRLDHIHPVFGNNLVTLPAYKHDSDYDCVLIDGPHVYPMPELEYLFLGTHVRPGGFLLVDDIHIASIGTMADVLQEDAMWDLVEIVEHMAVFRRTDAPNALKQGGWWTQGYNQRRTDSGKKFFLDDGGKLPSLAERMAARCRPQDARETKSRQKRWWQF